MQRYFLQLAYNGSAYHGWQIQPNAVSIQAVLEDALSKILRESIAIVGCGRTDTGVHARVFFAHFETTKIFEKRTFLKSINSFLPSDIAVFDCFPVSDDLHARFSAIYRTYCYYLTTKKNPFQTHSTYLIFRPIDFEAMNDAALSLRDFINFSAFSKSETQTATNNCIITNAIWEPCLGERELWVFKITADRFLRNMVRAIVGTLLEVGYGKITKQEFVRIIASKDRREAGISVPAHALFLEDVGYPTMEIEKGSSL